jgi:hypothetical protein
LIRRILLLGGLSILQVAAATQEPPPSVEALEALAQQPERFGDRQIRLTIFRALDAPSPDVVATAVDIVMGSADLAADPQLWRRFNAVLSGSDHLRRKAVLDRAVKKGRVSDIRVIALIVEALTDSDESLRSTALAVLKAQPELKQNPGIAEALGRAGEPVAGMVLPAFDVFKTRVQPVLERLGPDKKNCSNCHENHSVLRLAPMDSPSPADQLMLERYRAALRVVDVEAPERSLILRKPTSPKGEAAFTHGGDVRFEPDSPAYQAILGWIKTGRIAR